MEPATLLQRLRVRRDRSTVDEYILRDYKDVNGLYLNGSPVKIGLVEKLDQLRKSLPGRVVATYDGIAGAATLLLRDPSALVLAFEPDPLACRLLLWNIAEHRFTRRVWAVCAAVSDVATTWAVPPCNCSSASTWQVCANVAVVSINGDADQPFFRVPVLAIADVIASLAGGPAVAGDARGLWPPRRASSVDTVAAVMSEARFTVMPRADIVRLISANAAWHVLDLGAGRRKLPEADVGADLLEWVDSPDYFGAVRNEATHFADSEFDFVFSSHSVEHSTDPSRFCAEVSRIGKAGAVCFPTSLADNIFAVRPDGRWCYPYDHDHNWWVQVRYEHGPHLAFLPQRRVLRGLNGHPGFGPFVEKASVLLNDVHETCVLFLPPLRCEIEDPLVRLVDSREIRVNDFVPVDFVQMENFSAL